MTRDYMENPFPSTREEFLYVLDSAEDEGFGERWAAVEFIASWIAATAEHGYLEPSEIAQQFRKEFA